MSLRSLNAYQPVKHEKFGLWGTDRAPDGNQFETDLAGNPKYTITTGAPHNIEAEQQIIGVALNYPEVYAKVRNLRSEDFLAPEHAICWDEIGRMVKDGEPVLPSKLRARCGWTQEDQEYFVACLSNVVSFQGFQDYADAIVEAAQRRRIIETVKKIAANASNYDYETTAAEIAGIGVANLIDSVKSDGDFRTLASATKSVIDKWVNGSHEVRSTGFPRLDQALAGGFHRGRFYMIGARYKAGKSMMLSSISYQMTVLQTEEYRKKAKKILYLALEMGDEEISTRMLGRKIGVNAIDLLDPAKRTHPAMLAKARKAAEEMEACGLEFRNQPRMTLDDLKSTLARVGMSGKYDGVVLDYLQLVTGRKRNESIADHSDNVAQTCAEMCKRYGFWMLGAYQLNRDGAARGGDGPMNACDVAFELCREEGQPDAYLEMTATRYTRSMSIGSAAQPAYELVGWEGPYFQERRAP